MNTHYKVHGYALELANAFGFLYPAEVFVIHALAQAMPENPVAVCIGVGTGTGSLAIREMRNDARIYSVDISEGGPHGGMENERIAFAHANMRPTVQVLGNSQEVWRKWDEISQYSEIDLLFIDGDHAETALAGDIDGWAPFVKPGGWILFHDYGSVSWGDVTKVVDRRMGAGWRRILYVDTLIVFQREVVQATRPKAKR